MTGATEAHELTLVSGLAYCSCGAHWLGIHPEVMAEAHIEMHSISATDDR